MAGEVLPGGREGGGDGGRGCDVQGEFEDVGGGGEVGEGIGVAGCGYEAVGWVRGD